MSFEAMAWAVKQKTNNSGQKLVLLMLANHANGYTGQCNPSHKRMADECVMGESTLRKHLVALQELNLLEIVPKFVGTVQLPNQYNLLMGYSNQAEVVLDSGTPPAQIGLQNQEVKPVNKYIYKPDSVDQEIWDEFIQHRKKKKAQVTKLVLNNIIAEAEKAGWDLNRALTEICVRNWMSFKAEWVESKQTDVRSNYEKMMRL